ncbi:hypothetical protein PR048_012318 [Dryococelus australis]|uniref:Uncharacterized protein n=1 Tax=Dryococelus australis TaxID=614101 RepID=A0ABQ9HP01_9NEOP|nr:hypothetical protein PR048_012318 [Dryococelus australis]
MVNNKGPSTLPCGTPDVTSSPSDIASPTFTLCLRPLKKSPIHSTTLLSGISASTFLTNVPWGTLSNPFSKSMNPTLSPRYIDLCRVVLMISGPEQHYGTASHMRQCTCSYLKRLKAKSHLFNELVELNNQLRKEMARKEVNCNQGPKFSNCWNKFGGSGLIREMNGRHKHPNPDWDTKPEPLAPLTGVQPTTQLGSARESTKNERSLHGHSSVNCLALCVMQFPTDFRLMSLLNYSPFPIGSNFLGTLLNIYFQARFVSFRPIQRNIDKKYECGDVASYRGRYNRRGESCRERRTTDYLSMRSGPPGVVTGKERMTDRYHKRQMQRHILDAMARHSSLRDTYKSSRLADMVWKAFPIWRRRAIIPNALRLTVRLDCSPPTKANRLLSHPDFRKWESCRTMSLVGVFFPPRGSPISPALAFWRCSILTSLQPHRVSRPRAQPVLFERLFLWHLEGVGSCEDVTSTVCGAGERNTQALVDARSDTLRGACLRAHPRKPSQHASPASLRRHIRSPQHQLPFHYSRSNIMPRRAQGHGTHAPRRRSCSVIPVTRPPCWLQLTSTLTRKLDPVLKLKSSLSGGPNKLVTRPALAGSDCVHIVSHVVDFTRKTCKCSFYTNRLYSTHPVFSMNRLLIIACRIGTHRCNKSIALHKLHGTNIAMLQHAKMALRTGRSIMPTSVLTIDENSITEFGTGDNQLAMMQIAGRKKVQPCGRRLRVPPTCIVSLLSLAEKRGSYKGHTGTRYKNSIAAKRKAMNWRAVFSGLSAGAYPQEQGDVTCSWVPRYDVRLLTTRPCPLQLRLRSTRFHAMARSCSWWRRVSAGPTRYPFPWQFSYRFSASVSAPNPLWRALAPGITVSIPIGMPETAIEQPCPKRLLDHYLAPETNVVSDWLARVARLPIGCAAGWRVGYRALIGEQCCDMLPAGDVLLSCANGVRVAPTSSSSPQLAEPTGTLATFLPTQRNNCRRRGEGCLYTGTDPVYIFPLRLAPYMTQFSAQKFLDQSRQSRAFWKVLVAARCETSITGRSCHPSLHHTPSHPRMNSLLRMAESLQPLAGGGSLKRGGEHAVGCRHFCTSNRLRTYFGVPIEVSRTQRHKYCNASGEIREALYNDVLRADEGDVRCVLISDGMQEQGKREIP